MTALTAQGICHAYGHDTAQTPVLRDFSLTLAPGSFAALMGPSGSGKSTFLHLAAGLLVPQAGTIMIGDTDVTKLSDSAAARFRRRHLGVVFQDFNLLDELSVADNILLPARLDHARPNTARLADLLAKLGLADKAARSPRALSGGERQRVAVARALYAEPAVILADEPTGNLDVAASQALCALFRELNRTEKSAILLVTHDPVVAAAAERVHFLRDGRIAATVATEHAPDLVARHYLETCR